MKKQKHAKRWTKLAIMLLSVLLVFTACQKEEDIVTPEKSSFEISISGILTDYYEEYLPQLPLYSVYVRMHDLPDDEKIVSWGSCVSSRKTMPDKRDKSSELKATEVDIVRDWDWASGEDLIYQSGIYDKLIPGVTYYVRGFVKTTKNTYLTPNVETITPDASLLHPDTMTARREIPVVFHLFPDSLGNALDAQFVDDLVTHTNLVYRNAWGLSEGADAGIRFVLAEGKGYERPGVHRINVPITFDFNVFDENPGLFLRPEWATDPTQALNVWVAPVKHYSSDYVNGIAGFARLPFFDINEMLEGCEEYSESLSWAQKVTGIVLNSNPGFTVGDPCVFAHEAGHLLGLYHVFEEDYCDDTPIYNRLAYMDVYSDYMAYRPLPDSEGYTLSTNVMDYYISFMLCFTPEQCQRIAHTLSYGYFIPGGKTEAEKKSMIYSDCLTSFPPGKIIM